MTEFTDETAMEGHIADILENFNESEESITSEESSEQVVTQEPVPEPDAESSGESEEVSAGVFSEESSDLEEVVYEKETPKSWKKKTEQHREILADIGSTEKDLKEIRVEVPAYDEEKIINDDVYAEEIRNNLVEEYENHVMATSMREAIIAISKQIEKYFDGSFNKLIGRNLPDLDGYSTHIRMNISQIRRETVTVSKTFRSKLGKNPIVMIKLIQLFVFPLWTVYMKNSEKSKKKIMEIEDYDELESDDTETSESYD
ncbi:unnamed protein product [Ascophyllum nodosum]